jgi:hypothetical protein
MVIAECSVALARARNASGMALQHHGTHHHRHAPAAPIALANGVLDGSGDLKAAMDLPSSRRGVQAAAEITSALEVKT